MTIERVAMTDTIACPRCQTLNLLTAEVCRMCGAVLKPDVTLPGRDETTLRKVTDVLPDVERPPEYGADYEPGVLYLYISGAVSQEPLVHRGPEAVVLGRGNEGLTASEQVIDLIPYHAYSLGVSRRHALIQPVEDGYAIQDLGSSNGTWVNGSSLEPRQVYPLHRGDHLQLGELVIFVYFFN
jgi:hypothetical protein